MQRLSEQDFGHLVIREKIQSARWYAIELDRNGDASLPAELNAIVHDRSDRKFVAVALADDGQSSIVNACDTDWLGWEEGLQAAGIEVEQLLGEWCEEKRRE